MSSNEIKIKKSTFIISLGLILLLAFVFLSYNKTQVNVSNLEADTNSLESRFAMLSSARTNSCGGTFNYVDSMPDTSRIQGSCCGAMNFHRYSEQVEELKKYKDYGKIPSDPYDVSVSLAKELLDYQENIELNEVQQAVYDEALGISHEGGPCCCKCWHWYAYEGLAKYLITEEGFTAEQVAEVWDISDACGGSGHVDGAHGHT